MAAAEAGVSGTGRSTESGSVYDGFISYSHAADDLLAPRLQAGLQKFAKPWWKRRALRVFRDESSLSANPHLWSSITEALDSSEWFVLLLSPDAAESPWVNNEIEYWRSNYDADRIIPVLTYGEFSWTGGDVAGTSVPQALRGAFEDEPRWVDLRFAKEDEQLDLKNSEFSAAVADIASALRGVPKDELESEEVKQHRRTVRTAWAAGVALALLAVAAIGFGVRADQQTEVARSRELAASAINVMDQDPELSVLLALAALDFDQSPQALSVLHTALQQHRTIFSVDWSADRKRYGNLTVAISPDGSLVAITGMTSTVEVWEVSNSEEPLWQATIDIPDVDVRFPKFSNDGALVFVGAGPPNPWDPDYEFDAAAGYGIYAFDASTGREVNFIPSDGCFGFLGVFSGPGGLIDVSRPALAWGACGDPGSTDLGLIDLATGDINRVGPGGTLEFAFGSDSVSQDGRYLAMGFSDPINVVDLSTGEPYHHDLPGPHATFSNDGSFLLVGGDPLQLWDMAQEKVVREYPGEYWQVGFSEDRTLVYGARFDGPTDVFDRASGKLLYRLVGDPALFVEMSGDRASVASSGDRAQVYDIGSIVQGETDVLDFAGGGGYHLASALDSAGGVGVAWSLNVSDNSRRVMVFDLDSLEVTLSLQGEGAALSPDGSVLALQPALGPAHPSDVPETGEPGPYRKVGAVRLVDTETGETVVSLRGLCDWFMTDTPVFAGKDYGPGPIIPSDGCNEQNQTLWIGDIEFSPDGKLIAISGIDTGTVGVWDTGSGQLLWRGQPIEAVQGGWPNAVIFSPDSSTLVASDGFEVVAMDPMTGEEIARTPHTGNQMFYEMEFTPDGGLLLGSDLGNRLMFVDTATWEELDPLDVVTEGEGTRDFDLTSDGTLMATAGDRHLRLWSIADRAMRLEIEFAEQIRGVEFIDDTHLLVLPKSGNAAVVITLDPDELIEIALNRLTRGFSSQECATYLIDPCPMSLEELRG